ncbi:MAG: PAS domain S-box protein [Sneathiella sp.]|nr:PAS domain S-box protein [Sneathiella sp.]
MFGKPKVSYFLPKSISAKVNLVFAVICIIMVGTLVTSWLAFKQLGAQISEFNEVRAPSLSKSINLLSIANSFHELGPTLAGASSTSERQRTNARLVDYLNRMKALSDPGQREGLEAENQIRISALIERLKTSLTLLNSSAQYRILLLKSEKEKRVLFEIDLQTLQQRVTQWTDKRNNLGLKLIQFDRLINQYQNLILNWQGINTEQHFQGRQAILMKKHAALLTESLNLPLDIALATDKLTGHLNGKNHLVQLKKKQLGIKINTDRELEKVRVKITQIRLILSLNVKRTETAVQIAAEEARQLIRSRTAQLAIAVFAIIFVSYFASLIFVRRALVQRLTALGSSMQKIAAGKLNTVINTKGQDEIARMASALVGFRNTAREVEEQHTRAIIESSVAGLIMTDITGTIEFLSYTARQLFGYDPVSMPKNRHTIFDLIDPTERPALQSLMETHPKGIATGPDHSATAIEELSFHKKDGSIFPGDIACRSVTQRSGIKLIFTIYDVTDRKQAQQVLEDTVALRTADLQAANKELRQEVSTRQKTEFDLRSTKEELVQASKLASLGKMASGISHELNQPLMAISNWIHNASVLITKGDLKAAKQALDDMDIQVSRMIELASHLRTLARQPALTFTPTDPSETLTRALRLFTIRLSQDGGQIINEVPEGLFNIDTDSLRLEQIFINLVSNALDAMKTSKTRILTIQCEGLETDAFSISFTDTGPGINDTDLPHLFDPFFTTKEVGQGMGLGLSISYNIARMLGGNIYPTNNEAGGATFTLTLPYKHSSRLHPVQAEEIW